MTRSTSGPIGTHEPSVTGDGEARYRTGLRSAAKPGSDRLAIMNPMPIATQGATVRNAQVTSESMIAGPGRRIAELTASEIAAYWTVMSTRIAYAPSTWVAVRPPSRNGIAITGAAQPSRTSR